MITQKYTIIRVYYIYSGQSTDLRPRFCSPFILLFRVSNKRTTNDNKYPWREAFMIYQMEEVKMQVTDKKTLENERIL